MPMEFRKDLFADERDDNLNEIGKPTQRQDMVGHVTGRSPYYDDHLFDGLTHIRCHRSPHHAARIRRIDTAEAEQMPGVRRVILGRDVPTNLNTLLSLLDFGLDDEEVLATDEVRYRGEPVAAVVADTEREAREAAAAIRVEWEPLAPILNVEEAIKPGARQVNPAYPTNRFVYHDRYDHQKIRFGDVDAALRTADRVIEGRYQMSPIEQAPMETCGAIAAPETNDRFVCYTSTQGLFFSLGTAAKLLDVSSARLHFIGGTVGGGFGGKVDSLHEPLAILGTMLTGRPCKYMFDRAEEMQVGAPRGAEVWYLTDGVMNDGRIVARKFIGYFDSGAYTRLSSYAVVKGAAHLPGPYTIPNVYADVYCVYTNRTPATAMRGFGITGVDFAIESHMDVVADEIGVDPFELRIINAYRDGDMKAHRRVAKNTALIECVQVAAEKAGVRLSPAMRAASSLKDGGGVRGELPAHTALDDHGRITGTASAGSAPRISGGISGDEAMRQQDLAAARFATPTPRPSPAAAAAAPAAAGAANPPPAPQPSPAPTPAEQSSEPAPGSAPAPRRQPARFSSISGLRRR